MTRFSMGRRVAAVAAAAALSLVGMATAQSAAAANDVLNPEAPLWVNPHSTTLDAAKKLKGQAKEDAQLLGGYASATWFTSGTPKQVEKDVSTVVKAADKDGAVPVLVAYNLPYRDCAQYSAGGAADTAEYQAWIDGVVAGIGDRDAAVILEPDGLGIIPWYTNLDGTLEWCQPADLDPATAAASRFAQLNYAVDALSALPNTVVYLDGTHNGWLNVGDASDRLLKAGVQNADGFFLNVSNYQYTANLEQYGTWVSTCITYATQVNEGDFASCGSQYWSGGPANGWQGTALTQFGEWSDTATDPALNTAGVNSRYESILGGVEPAVHFVLDTSRNGQGPWDAGGTEYSDPEDWCNPPARGLGAAPTTDTGNELVDAYLWIKVPGESDGQCFRGTGGPEDPERGMIDPAAGQWFPEQARELIELAQPAL
ncbi:glycoside hydrolase family 6 protein [Naasia sp. SYSU D00057]|uniref:glycoside hydrolase family 6 protein n=1 Tax=Naasia sp. SYSU D00057 TaxID=2817380 RepID=UPI001B3006F2|nr:glycoside hydrolase family 6 protein [Naasia sp. SYSU D00057]